MCDQACQEFQNTQRSRRGEKTGRFPFGVGIDRQEEFLVREPPISSDGSFLKGQMSVGEGKELLGPTGLAICPAINRPGQRVELVG